MFVFFLNSVSEIILNFVYWSKHISKTAHTSAQISSQDLEISHVEERYLHLLSQKSLYTDYLFTYTLGMTIKNL